MIDFVRLLQIDCEITKFLVGYRRARECFNCSLWTGNTCFLKQLLSLSKWISVPLISIGTVLVNLKVMNHIFSREVSIILYQSYTNLFSSEKTNKYFRTNRVFFEQFNLIDSFILSSKFSQDVEKSATMKPLFELSRYLNRLPRCKYSKSP